MKKHVTPGTWTKTRTTFKLTDEEVIEALVDYVEKDYVEKNETIPPGNRFVWLRDTTICRSDEGPLATLVIDTPFEPESSGGVGA